MFKIQCNNVLRAQLGRSASSNDGRHTFQMLYLVLLCIAAFICGSSFGLYLYLTWHFNHWLKRRIPGTKPKPLLGTFPGTIRGTRNFIYDLDEVYRQYKQTSRFVGVFMTRNPQIMILDPELCKDILIGNFKNFQDNESSKWMNRSKEPVSGSNPFVLPSADWKTKRSEIVPGLTQSKVKGMFPIIESASSKLTQYLRSKVQSGSCAINAKEIALRYTGEVVADTVWGIKANNLAVTADSLDDEVPAFLSMSKQMIAQTFRAFQYFFLVGIFPVIKCLLYVRFHPELTDRFFLKLTHSSLQARQSQAAGPRSDFLQHLLELHQKKGLNETEILAHMLTFHFDGFETSATLISHCLLLLARYPEAQQMLRKEIKEHLDMHHGALEFDDLTNLPYLEQCIAETLRIFTPLPFMAKMCTETCEFTNSDGVTLTVQTGDVCLISLHSMHHDEEYFPQPEVFMPERFAAAQGGTKIYRDMGVYLPFGDGPRICLGMKFGVTQAKAAIVEVIKHFELTVNERTRTDNYQAAGGFITGLDGGIFLDMKEL